MTSLKSVVTSRLAFVASLTFAAFNAGCAAEVDAAGDEQVESTEESLTRAQCRGAIGETDARCRLEGVVESVFIGEMDPYVVGDACVTFVKVGNKRYGLVQEMDDSSCPDPDHFAAGNNVKVSFSKGALDLSSRSRAQVLKEYDADATYYEFTGTLRESTSPTSALTTFDALDDSAKVAFLYEVTNGGSWATLRAGVAQKPIRIVDTQTGTARARALEAYHPIASYSYSNGGAQPGVYALQKDGVTYAYAIEASGRSYGNWGTQHVYDREWNELASFGYAD